MLICELDDSFRDISDGRETPGQRRARPRSACSSGASPKACCGGMLLEGNQAAGLITQLIDNSGGVSTANGMPRNPNRASLVHSRDLTLVGERLSSTLSK